MELGDFNPFFFSLHAYVAYNFKRKRKKNTEKNKEKIMMGAFLCYLISVWEIYRCKSYLAVIFIMQIMGSSSWDPTLKIHSGKKIKIDFFISYHHGTFFLFMVDSRVQTI